MTAHHDPRRPATAEEEHLAAYAEWLDRDEPPAWFREQMQRDWRVGERVRVTLNGECSVDWHNPDCLNGHPSALNGAVGTVIVDRYRQPAPWHDTHPYVVEFDVPLRAPLWADGSEGFWGGGYFCAAELSPLDTPATGAAGRATDEGEGR